MIRNHALDPENYSSPAEGYGNYGSDFSDFDGTSNEDPWYSKSPDKPGASTPDIPRYGSGDDMSSGYTGRFDADEDYENEAPLLEELGIRFDHIWSKTQAVIIPIKHIDEHILDDADIAGPLVYCMLLGAVLLLSGKVHFGYIYGFSIFGCSSLYTVINLLDSKGGLDIWRTSSVLGYCMLPIIGLAALSIVLDLRGVIGFIVSVLVVIWSTAASTRIFDSKLQLTEQYWLVAYPIMLLYSCFVLITVF
mmetsp:Transcript_4962/g.7582  ORF Transcript_4962/g.7582 Transcript_4962/m.7582 type:complete len:249 (-) Transcript_4962:84-830(-)